MDSFSTATAHLMKKMISSFRICPYHVFSKLIKLNVFLVIFWVVKFVKITCWIQLHITAQLLIILRTILNMSCMKDPSWWLDDFYKPNRFWGHSIVKNELWIHWAQIWYIFKIWRWKWYKSTKIHKVWKFQSPMINNWTPGGRKLDFPFLPQAVSVR